VRGTITLEDALPDLSTDVDIEGPGASLLTVARDSADGTPDFRIFTVPAGVVVTIAGLTISGGNAPSNATINGPQALGGGILNAGSLTVTNSTISHNSCGVVVGQAVGGGIDNTGTLTLTDSTIIGNSVGGFSSGASGGGISNSGTLTITDSTISGNSSLSPNLLFFGGEGGGVDNSGTLTITDSTISGNSAGQTGGGISNGGTLTMTDSTISGNSIVGVLVALAAGGIDNSGKLTATASLFANSQGVNVVNSGTFLSGGHNLFSDTPSVPLNITDLTNTDPLLGPLADNGGPTQTMALLPGSPAIDAGVTVPGITTDQRGVSRPQGSAPDIGAFESRGFTLSVTGGNSQTTLANTPFPAPLAFTLTSSYGEPVAGGRVTFSAPGTGPSAVLSSQAVTLHASGNGTVSATANAAAGTYAVTASAAGAKGVSWSLTNFLPPPPRVNGLVHTGIHWQPTRIFLTFDQPMDPATVQYTRNYIVIAGAGWHVRAIPVTSAVYTSATQSVTLTTAQHLNIHYRYTLFVNGSSPYGVRSASGVKLDGTGTGKAGTNYVKSFGIDSLVWQTTVPRSPVLPRHWLAPTPVLRPVLRQALRYAAHR
jgi:hypothetical protein